MKKIEEIKQYAESYFKTECTNAKLVHDIKLKIYVNPIRFNASLTLGRNLTPDRVRINIKPTFLDHRPESKRKIEMASNISHELEHAKTFIKTQEDDFYSFEQLVALMEFIYCANIFKINPNKLSLSGYKLFKLKKQFDNNYDVSMSEINANLIGYQKAFHLHGSDLPEQDKLALLQIIKALEILNDNMEIYYDNLGGCHNRFSLLLINVSEYIRKYPEIFDRFKILHHLFNRDGSIKKLDAICQSINNDNEKMYKKLIIHYIISIKDGYYSDIDTEKYRDFLEELIADYINSAINFFKNMKMCKIFIKKEKMLSDNLKLKKKNIEVLLDYAKKHQLSVKTGILLDNSCFGSKTQAFQLTK